MKCNNFFKGRKISIRLFEILKIEKVLSTDTKKLYDKIYLINMLNLELYEYILET